MSPGHHTVDRQEEIREALKEKALDEFSWKDENRPSSVRQTLELFQIRRDGAHMGLSECIDTILKRTELCYISALKQTHCPPVACDSKWVTVFLHSLLFVHRGGIAAVLFVVTCLVPRGNAAIFGACSVQRKTITHHFTVLFEAIYVLLVF